MQVGVKARIMERLQKFQSAARECGFVVVNESEEGTVLWLRKDTAAGEIGQRMCIDSVTNSMTIFWKPVSGRLNSKTFRGISALEDWLNLGRPLLKQ